MFANKFNQKTNKMKNLSLLFVAFLIVFASCSSDDDANNQIDLSVDITGSWDLTKLDYEGDSQMTFQGQTITLDYTGFAKDIDAQVVFSKNPDIVESFGSYTIEMTVTYMGMSETYDTPLDMADYINPGTWSIQGNQMIIVDQTTGEQQTAEIIHLSQNKMILVSQQSQNMNGMTVNVYGETTLER
jgi:hypothetical protein